MSAPWGRQVSGKGFICSNVFLLSVTLRLGFGVTDERKQGFFQFFNSFFFQFFFVVCLFFIHIFKCLTSVILSNISILFSYSAFRHQLRCSMLNISIVSLPLFECAYCLAALRRLWHLWKGQWVIGTRQRGRWRGEGDSIVSWCSQSVSQSVCSCSTPSHVPVSALIIICSLVWPLWPLLSSLSLSLQAVF